MAKGNPKAYLNSHMCDNTEIDSSENAILVQYALDVFNTTSPDLSKPEEVEKTINSYFKNCISKGLRPGNLGLYASLGLDKNNVKDILTRGFKTVNGRTVNSASKSLIKSAIKAIGAYREMLGSQGKLNPATLIFWQKNFDGLEDVQRTEISVNQPLEAAQTPEQIAAKIEQDIPVDTIIIEPISDE